MSGPPPAPRAPRPPIRFLLHLMPPDHDHISALPLPAPCALMMKLSHSSLTPMTLSSRLTSLIHQMQTPESSRSAAKIIAINSTLKSSVSFPRPMHPLHRSRNLSTSSIALGPHAASSPYNAPVSISISNILRLVESAASQSTFYPQ